MKEAEAIQAIKNNMPTKGTYTILTEALNEAITALDKQIPKKGLYRWDYGCPVCDSNFEYTHAYCPKCGQALDWSKP